MLVPPCSSLFNVRSLMCWFRCIYLLPFLVVPEGVIPIVTLTSLRLGLLRSDLARVGCAVCLYDADELYLGLSMLAFCYSFRELLPGLTLLRLYFFFFKYNPRLHTG